MKFKLRVKVVFFACVFNSDKIEHAIKIINNIFVHLDGIQPKC